jgi:hypothetical protein
MVTDWDENEIFAEVLLAVSFICSFQRSYKLNAVQKYFNFTDRRTEYLNMIVEVGAYWNTG